MNLAFALSIDQRWESARAEYERALAIDPSCQLAKARLDQLNTLVAKMESRNGTRRDPPLVATSTAAPPARHGPDGPTASPEQTTVSGALRDPALLATATVSPSRSAARPSIPPPRPFNAAGTAGPPAQ